MPITKKEAEAIAKKIVIKVLEDKNYLLKLFKNLMDKEDAIRYPNAIALEILCKENPHLIYPDWNFFVNLLKSKNAYHKSIAISTISNLIKIDEKNRFDEIFEDFFNLIDDKSVLVSRKLVINAFRIAIAKPALRAKITEILLSINRTQHTSNRKDLIKGDIIESFSKYFKDIKNKEKIIQFVKTQLESSSPRTVKKAKEFLSKWEEEITD
ncbi:MAG: hypothetical protein ACFFEY_10350 [Candidatus Thorarchaeota archaeon]